MSNGEFDKEPFCWIPNGITTYTIPNRDGLCSNAHIGEGKPKGFAAQVLRAAGLATTE